ncbi:MAG: MurR/RpiR family transcriptional regulator [Erysipelotrichaceae bacterium]|nr:MurR/RpiR family transcriptional regulator [Erysipelotrichaceae bacterium]
MITELFNTITLTPQQQQLVQSINEHPDWIKKYNAKELAQMTYVSASTIVRFTQKLGFKGYLDFQKTFIREYTHQNTYNQTIHSESSINDVIEILPAIYQEVLLETSRNMQKEVIVRVINYMLQAKQIDFYANNNNYSYIQSAALKLNSLGIHAQAYNTINHDYVDSFVPSDVLSFVISHSGNNQTMVDAYYLRKKRSRVIGITSHLDHSLELICNESFIIDASSHGLPHGISIYGLSIQYVLDLLIIEMMIKKKRL